MRQKKIVPCRIILFLFGFILVFASAPTARGNDGDLNKSGTVRLNPNVSPGGNFDLSIWSLQLPTGSPSSITIIPPARLSGPNGYTNTHYFFTDKTDGAMTFMDPATGFTTSGSLHCRTELREMSGWTSAGTNIMTVTGEVVQVGGGRGGHVTVGQIFDLSASTPMCELEYCNSGTFQLMLENTNKGGSAAFHALGVQSVGSLYTYSLSIADTKLIVTVNGSSYAFTPDKSFKGDQFNFKCGDYDQTATSGPPSTTPYTVVKVYSLKVLHGNAATTAGSNL